MAEDAIAEGAMVPLAGVRICPRCSQACAFEEFYCYGSPTDPHDAYPISDLPIHFPESREGTAGSDAPSVGPQTGVGAASQGLEPNSDGTLRTCANGHPVSEGDLLCASCGCDLISLDEPGMPGFGEGVQTPFDPGLRPFPNDRASNGIGNAATDLTPSPVGNGQEIGAPTEGTAPNDDVLEPAAPTVIAGWVVEAAVNPAGGNLMHEASALEARPAGLQALATEIFIVRHSETDVTGLMSIFGDGQTVDEGVYTAWRELSKDHVPELIETGSWEGRDYEVAEHLSNGTLAQLEATGSDEIRFERVAVELASALRDLGGLGLRHRALNPHSIRVRTVEPLDLVISSFGSARRSTFDLDIGQPLEQSRYSAPEALAGIIGPEGDWWSLGIILLEQATGGACFEGVNDNVFLMHAQALGIAAPEGLPERMRTLINGLLQRDRARRWAWPEFERWLAGEAPECAPDVSTTGAAIDAPVMRLGQRDFRDAANFAVQAARAENWQEARDKLVRGEIATWVADLKLPKPVQTRLKALRQKSDLSDDLRLALSLRCLHDAVPFVIQGNIVTPAWLLEAGNRAAAYDLVTGPAPDLLADWFGDRQLRELKQRAQAARLRAGQLEIPLNEELLRIAILATSRARLEQRFEEKRILFPDAAHIGLASLLRRRQINDVDLIILLSAEVQAFLNVDDVVAAAASEASEAGITSFVADAARQRLSRPQHEVLAELRTATGDLAVCERTKVDDWVERFRLERRIPLARALAVLAIPAEEWKEPSKQNYYRQLVSFFEKKVTASLSRGPLVRMTVSPTSPRLDLVELGTPRKTSVMLLNHFLSRNGRLFELDPGIFADPAVSPDGRIRRLEHNAKLYKRDTGIDGLYVGFPFLVQRDSDDARQPRIAPILLWPARLDVAVGLRGNVKLAFDDNREDVRLNPALEAMVSAEELRQWREIVDELLSRSTLTISDVIDGFGSVLETNSSELAPLPSSRSMVMPGKQSVFASAVLFNVEYAAQAVVDDLRTLQRRDSKSTALGRLLKIDTDAGSETTQVSGRVAEEDRYFTAAIDPSQEKAVVAGRQGAGLLLEGPPGTGKSQTIVNIITDAIGRGRSVLVVCQKQAALDVVQKRLVAMDLSDRFVMVGDVNKDRQRVLDVIREQVRDLRRESNFDLAAIAADRTRLAQKLTRIEAEIDQRHELLRWRDPRTGHSYRELLAQLIAISDARIGPVDAPELRDILGPLGQDEVSSIARNCASVARVWLPARYEGNPYEMLKPFSPDDATLARFWSAFERVDAAEVAREIDLATPHPFEIDSVEPAKKWLQQATELLLKVTPDEARRQAAWSWHFLPSAADPQANTAGDINLQVLHALAVELRQLMAVRASTYTIQQLLTLDDKQLASQLQVAERAHRPASLWDWISFGRVFARREARQIGASLGLEQAEVDRGALVSVLRREIGLRSIKQKLNQQRRGLKLKAINISAAHAEAVAKQVAKFEAILNRVRSRVALALTSPVQRHSLAILERGQPELLVEHLNEVEAAIERAERRRASRLAINAAADWFEATWISRAFELVDRFEFGRVQRAEILSRKDSLRDYQSFRRRAGLLSETERSVLGHLRRQEDKLRQLPIDTLAEAVAATIEGETRLAWKQRLEGEQSELLIDERVVAEKLKELASCDEQLRALNARFLAATVDRDPVTGTFEDWRQFTRLRGRDGTPRSSIRDVVEQGVPRGLLSVRPVWLMNPDVASRILPLKPGLFDLVIFDEASQMPVEYALPTLFRAKVATVSGDEKQMPPASFFSAQLDDDENDADEALAELDRETLAETWNRREIKDCPDLLQLARSALPWCTLDVHYRSSYRELIAFSNAAFYGNRLNVPVQHPEAKVRKFRPLEVVRVDGVYRNQTNRDEADRVVSILAKIWSKRGTLPSIGVVTFNRKQADLISDRIEAYAEADANFREALIREQSRIQDHEDIGFFVKNVENVQGDERDYIIFSTTFGPNENGTFRRNFGVLGQSGGRRRLNVAISRAREKIILVTSMPTAKISDMLSTSAGPETERDYLQGYLAYAEAISSGSLSAGASICQRMNTQGRGPRSTSKVEMDGFMASVERFVGELGYLAVVASTNDVFSLDFAIQHPSQGHFVLGIECDAPSHPMLATARAREIWRSSILANTIGPIHRISATDWFGCRDEEQERLRQAIEKAIVSRARRAA